MNTLSVLCAAFTLAGLSLGADAGSHRYLYMASPDGAQAGGSGNGILVFDIDEGHRFVKRMDVPSMAEGVRGFCGNARNHCVYYTTTNRRLGCFDVETEKVLWERQYSAGCDRASIPPNGEKIFVPTGWWWQGPNSGLLVVDAKTGDLLKEIPVNVQAHNSIASLDGKYVYLGTATTLTVFDAKTDEVLKTIQNVGESGVFPFTVDSRNRAAYVCLGQHVGFDVVDLASGKATHRVLAGEEPIAHRTHGAALTPDEKELWISDQAGKKLFIFDATRTPPAPKGFVELSAGGHGWVCFSLDGQYAWCHTEDVFDARTKNKVASLKDENGDPVSGSKFIEIHFRDGKVTRMGNEFGLGRAHLAQD